MTELRARLVLIGLCLGVLAAVACPAKPPVTPSQDADAALPAVTCSDACAHLVEVPCQVQRMACVQVCDRLSDKDPAYPGCVARAKSCAEADKCDRGR